MSHGKETPRQKMINLMYLVLTCLLALNVSREVLFGFVSINESLEQSCINFDEAAKKSLSNAEQAITAGHPEVAPYLAKAHVVNSISAKMGTYIDSLKKVLIRYTEDTDGADTLKLAQASQLENNDKPAFLLLGDDEANPKKGVYSAFELKEKLNTMCDTLLELLQTMSVQKGTHLPENEWAIVKAHLQNLKPKESYAVSAEKPVSWEIKQFHNLPMAAIVTQLTRMQTDIKQVNAEALDLLSSAAGKLSISFDRMEARVVPKQLYVQQGEAFDASVFLGASSTKFTRDNLKFILGDVDTITGQLAPGAVELPMENGSAAIRLPGNVQGNQTVKGWIRLQEGTGEYKYFRYQKDYVVAPPSVAISAEKMNVVYTGVDNPMKISAAGIAPAELFVKAEGGEVQLQNKGNGDYSVNVESGKTITITVYQRKPEGLKMQGTPKVFRVKDLPNPPFKIMGKQVTGTTEMSLAEVRSISAISLDLSNYEFATNFKLKSFSLIVGNGSSSVSYIKCDDGTLNAQALDALRRAKRGAKIYIEDAVVIGPGKKIRNLPYIKILVK